MSKGEPDALGRPHVRVILDEDLQGNVESVVLYSVGREVEDKLLRHRQPHATGILLAPPRQGLFGVRQEVLLWPHIAQKLEAVDEVGAGVREVFLILGELGNVVCDVFV